MKNIVFILSIIGYCLLVACERDSVSKSTVEQPPYTDTGANVLSCYIDGKLAVFKDPAPNIFTHYVPLFYPSSKYYTDTFLSISANKSTDTNVAYIQINTRQFSDTGKYYFDRYVEGKSWMIYEVSNNPQFGIMYVTFKGSTAEMHVKKLDTINKIISGTFSGSLRIYQYGPEIVNITNGRFDYKYDEYK